MRELAYIPKQCQETVEDGKIIAPTFAGSIKIRVPTFDERYEILEKSGVKVGSKGEIEVGENALLILRNTVKISKDFYIAVEIRKLSDGTEYKSFEDMSVDPDCDALLIDVAHALRGGFKPSKN